MPSELPFTAYPVDHLLTNALVDGRKTEYVQDYVDRMIDAGLVHTIHVSERRAFRNCRQRWQWAYAEDLHGTDSIRALEFGLAYHHAMEKFYDPETWHLDKMVLAEHAIAEFKRYTIDTYRKFVQRGMSDDRLAADFEDRLVSGEQMLRHYFNEVAPETDTFVPLEVEIAFEVPLLDPDGKYILCQCSRCVTRAAGIAPFADRSWTDWLGLPVTIGGRLDALVRDTETGELMVLDWKTAATLMQENELDFLEMDDQISTYLLAMHKLGMNARRFIYHEERKAAPQPPEPLTKRYRGRMYQASKDLPTSYDVYYETVAEGDPAGLAMGAYDDYLKWLKNEGPKFYQRTIVGRNDAQLRSTEHFIYLEYLDMLSGRIYPNQSRKQCSWCNFFEPCLGKQRGEPYEHSLKTLYVKGGRELSNDKNQPKPPALPKREPGEEAEKVDQEIAKTGARKRVKKDKQ